MNHLRPLKSKYHRLYWQMVEAAAQQSVATRHKVGAIVVTPEGMISPGWNGMPVGFENECEIYDPSLGRGKTRPEVIHAEHNAIDKMLRRGISTNGAELFVSRSPCLNCAKLLHSLGLAHVHYWEAHDDESGLLFLKQAGIPVSSPNQ